MRDSHRSLRDDYEVSCQELDLMVEIAAAQPGLIGARMTGGGFGGCTINLVECAAVSDFRRNVAAAYFSKAGLTPDIFVSPATDGAQQIAVLENRPLGDRILSMSFDELNKVPHRRFNPLLREWVLVSPLPDRAPLVGQSGENSAASRSHFRSQLLLVPWQPARGGSANAALYANLRF